MEGIRLRIIKIYRALKLHGTSFGRSASLRIIKIYRALKPFYLSEDADICLRIIKIYRALKLPVDVKVRDRV